MEFEFYLSPNCVGTNRKRYHARPTNQQNVDNEMFIKKMCSRSVAGEAETQAVMLRAADLLAELLAEGCHVHLDGIGSFQVSLSCPETRTMSSTRSGSVGIKSVTFRPAKELLKEVRDKAVLKRAKIKNHSNEDGEMDTLLLKLGEYFRTNRFINTRILESDFGILTKTAQRRIRRLVEMGKIRNVGTDRRHPLYEAVPGAF